MTFQEVILFISYALVLSALIFYTNFFGLFKDKDVSSKKLTLLFVGKLLAIPVFLFVYTKMYGGIENFDTGKFYHDVKVISNYGKTDPGFLFRLIFGLQNDTHGSPDFINCLQYTLNWDNGTVKDYLYNDNRVLIRTHVLLNFIAFNSYMAHALLNCFLSFIGIFFLYKTFKEWFVGKEMVVLIAICFFPALWFYTGALLKEGLTFFILGCILYHLKKITYREFKWWNSLYLVFLLFLSLLLKPYLLLFSAISFSLFFSIYYSERIKRKILVFFSTMLIAILFINVLSLVIKDRTLLGAALKHQRIFIGVAKGGIFLSDTSSFIRLSNDTSQIKRVKAKKDVFTIRKNASYMYWKAGNQKDTLFCEQNKDTITAYQLVYVINKSQSNIELPQNSSVSLIASCFYYTLFYPTFFSSKNALQLLAAGENLLILACILLIILGLFRSSKSRFLPLVFVFFALSLCLLIGLTAPNSGAIFRYRSPAMIFLLLTALYYRDELTAIFRKKQKTYKYQ